jgi:DNA-binding transcriptional regulator YiaG
MPVDPAALRRAREAIGWSQSQVAARTGWTRPAVQAWEAGAYACPQDVAAWMFEVEAVMARHPAPVRGAVPPSVHTASPP